MYVKMCIKTAFWVINQTEISKIAWIYFFFRQTSIKKTKSPSNYKEMIIYHFSSYVLHSQPDKHCWSMIRKYLVVFKNYILQYVNQTELDIVWGFMLENNDDYVLYIAVVWISNDNFTVSHYKICQMEFCNLS